MQAVYYEHTRASIHGYGGQTNSQKKKYHGETWNLKNFV